MKFVFSEEISIKEEKKEKESNMLQFSACFSSFFVCVVFKFFFYCHLEIKEKKEAFSLLFNLSEFHIFFIVTVDLKFR